MLRSSASRLRNAGAKARRAFSTGAPSLPARKELPESTAGFFSLLGGGKSMPSLDIPLQGLDLPPSLPDHPEPAKTRITTLANGMRIASESSSSPVAVLGLYVDSGSIYETPTSRGASHLLERMAFKTTRNRTHFRLVREVEAFGGNISASASREQMGYNFDALKTYVPEMVEILVDSVRNAVFFDWEVNEQLIKVKSEIANVSNNPQNLLMEALHAAGYSGALGNPLIAPESATDKLNGTILEEFVAQNYTAPRMVLAASGVDHEWLLSLAEPLLHDLPKVSVPEIPKSTYVGGDYRTQADSPDTHVAIAFEVPGGWRNEKDAIVLTVLQLLMGGGGSFSAGGPGKGMHSRLYRRVLNEFHEVTNFTAFNSMYNDSGLFGIHLTTGSDFVSRAVELAARELLLVAKSGEVSDVELDRAKNSTKSAILMNLESRDVVTEDIGRQILTYGQRKPVDHFMSMLNEVTLEDITSLAQKIVSTPLTMASWGDVTHVPKYDQVNKVFGKMP